MATPTPTAAPDTAATTTLDEQDPEPFTVTFDFEQDWCSRDVTDVVYELVHELEDTHPDLATLLTRELKGLDNDDAHELLTGYVRDLEEMVADGEVDDDLVHDELLDDLRQAAASLTYCAYSCTCSSDAYDSWGADELNEYLSGLGDHVWAVTRPHWRDQDDLESDIDDTLTLDTLFNIVASRDGWTSCELKWDAQSLSVSFGIYRAGSTELVLTPLDVDQKRLWDTWTDADPYGEDVAARVVAADQSALEATVDLWRSTDKPDEVYGEFGDLLAAVTTVGAHAVEHLDVNIVTRLAPGWSAGLDNLLLTSLDLAGIVPTPVANPAANPARTAVMTSAYAA